MIIFGFAAIVKHTRFSDIAVFISNIFVESSRAPAGDSSGDTSENIESKYYYFDSDMGLFCEIALSQSINHKFRTECFCKTVIFADKTVTFDCPACGEYVIAETFVLNPDFEIPQVAQYYRFDDNAFDFVLCEKNETITHKYYHLCSCGAAFYADSGTWGTCPNCLSIFDDSTFVLNPEFDFTVTVSARYGYREDVWSYEECTFEECQEYRYWYLCSCGAAIYCNEPSVGCCPSCVDGFSESSFSVNPDYTGAGGDDSENTVDPFELTWDGDTTDRKMIEYDGYTCYEVSSAYIDFSMFSNGAWVDWSQGTEEGCYFQRNVEATIENDTDLVFRCSLGIVVYTNGCVYFSEDAAIYMRALRNYASPNEA